MSSTFLIPCTQRHTHTRTRHSHSENRESYREISENGSTFVCALSLSLKMVENAFPEGIPGTTLFPCARFFSHPGNMFALPSPFPSSTRNGVELRRSLTFRPDTGTVRDIYRLLLRRSNRNVKPKAKYHLMFDQNQMHPRCWFVVKLAAGLSSRWLLGGTYSGVNLEGGQPLLSALRPVAVKFDCGPRHFVTVKVIR